MTQVDDSKTPPVVSRRTMIAGTGALAAGALVTTALLKSDAIAQEGGETQIPATPLALGPAMPPQFTDYANDWTSQNGNLSNTRASAGTTIDSTNVSTLGIAWSFPITTIGAYGALTSNPIINGNTVYLVDMLSNIWALDKTTGEQL